MPLGPRLSLLALASLALLSPGCSLLLPEVSVQTVTHNPFPQLSRVAVLPFFNQSSEATVDGRAFAEAYFAALQETRGFEVVPVNVAENAARRLRTDLADPNSRRQLAYSLGVDAVVVGSVTDYTPYYPPRLAMRVDWYAANSGFHAIPVGYGLPWGTPAEEFIPGDVVFGAEMELARSQLATQSPVVDHLAGSGIGAAETLPAPAPREPSVIEIAPEGAQPIDPFEADGEIETLPAPPAAPSQADQASHAIALGGGASAPAGAAGAAGNNGIAPAQWPDARGFTPPGPSPMRPVAQPYNGPVISHTRLFRGSDAGFTAALASYYGFQDDARFGGWESYLDRSDDFIRFCCHLHLQETLSARGGGGETRVVRRWSNDR